MQKVAANNASSRIRALDLFCGAGGSSWGTQLAGVDVVAAVDMWSLARDAYKDNFPDVQFYLQAAESCDLKKIANDIATPIQLLLASPECTNHSCAKGKLKRSEESRMTAFEVVRFAESLKPRWIIVENVIQMRDWKRYDDWLKGLKDLGYFIREQTLNASDFGVPQSRKRLFVTCDLEASPPEIIPPSLRKIRNASAAINPNGRYQFSPLKSPKRAKATLERAERAIAGVGCDKPFLMVYYGSDFAGGWQKLDVPLRTITTLDRFAYVRPGTAGPEMRMLQVPELKKAMGFPARYKLNSGTRRDRIKLLGNAVCPPVMKTIVQQIVASQDSKEA